MANGSDAVTRSKMDWRKSAGERPPAQHRRALLATGFALLARGRPGRVWFGRRTDRVKPTADIYLRVCFAAEVPRFGGVGCLLVPFKHRELAIAAANHEPVIGAVGDPTADFTAEFLKRCHR